MQLNKFLFFPAFFCLVFCQQGNEAKTAAANLEQVAQNQPQKPKTEASPEAEILAKPETSREYLTGKFSPEKDPDFEKVEKPYTDKPGMFLRKEALEAFIKMHKAAKKEGVSLKIISSTRTFAQQKNIWETKWAKLAKEFPGPVERSRKILEFSSMPGTSRHHWGTDIDLNDLNNRTFEEGGKENKTYKWLAEHAHEYGFCQPYTPKGKERPNGYNEEKWHWSFTPISKHLLEDYLKMMDDSQISGFKGAETALEIGAVKNYAGGISNLCR